MPKSSAPKAPTYMPPAAYQAPPPYQAPAPFVSPPDPQTVVPKVLDPNQVMDQGASVEAQLPSWLQLNQNPMDPNGLAQYQNNFYQQQIAPQLAQAQSDLYSNGQSFGSYGGALLGQMSAQGQSQAYNAGLNYAQQLFQNQLAGRQSYYSGGPTVAAQQNAADVNRGLGIAGLQSSTAQNHNQYNLGSAQMQNSYGLDTSQLANNYNLSTAGMQNNFNLSNYQNQLQAYAINQANQANRFSSIFGGLGSIFSGGRGLMGGGGGGGFGGGFGGVGGFGASPGTFSLGSSLGSSPAPLQSIHGAIM